MPRLILVKKNEVPPESGDIMGFRYVHPETGHISHSRDIGSWMEAINKYRVDNGFPAVDQAEAIDQLCKILPPGWCKYETGERPAWYVNTRLGVMDIFNGTKVLTNFFLAGMPLVDKDLAASRSAICARCPYNVATAGCAPCIGLNGLVEGIGGSIKTPSDSSLKSCAICKCGNLAQTRLPIEILAKGVEVDHLQKFPKDFCWKISELREAGLA